MEQLKMNRNCQDVMTKNPTTCGQTAPIVEAAKLMEREGVGSIPVCEDGRLVGIVTDRDIAMRVVAEGRDPRETTIEDVMTRDPESVSAEEPIARALEVMESRQVRRIPVIDAGGKLVGIIAQADIATRLGDDHATGEIVEAISQGN
jgi:CBS domain-containing protein